MAESGKGNEQSGIVQLVSASAQTVLSQARQHANVVSNATFVAAPNNIDSSQAQAAQTNPSNDLPAPAHAHVPAQPISTQPGAKPRYPAPAVVKQYKKARKAAKTELTRLRNRIYGLMEEKAPAEDIRRYAERLFRGFQDCAEINNRYMLIFPHGAKEQTDCEAWISSINDDTNRCMRDYQLYLNNQDPTRAGQLYSLPPKHETRQSRRNHRQVAFAERSSHTESEPRSPRHTHRQSSPSSSFTERQRSSSSASSSSESEYEQSRPFSSIRRHASPPLVDDHRRSHGTPKPKHPSDADLTTFFSNLLRSTQPTPEIHTRNRLENFSTPLPSRPQEDRVTSHLSAHRNESWIAALDRPDSGHGVVPPSWLMSLLPRTSIKPFDGDSREWPLFASQFKTLVHDVVPYDGQRLAILIEHLGPKIKNRFARTFSSPDMYAAALRELERRYGNPQRVASTHVDDLISHVRDMIGKNFDFYLLDELSERVHSAVIALQHGGHVHDLNSAAVLRQVTQALPEAVARRWIRHSRALRPETPSLVDLDFFLDEVVEEERALRETHASRARSTKIERQKLNPKPNRLSHDTFGKSKPAPPPSTVLAAYSDASKKRWCLTCRSFEHATYTCQRFKDLSPSQRAELAKDNGYCFRCLNGRHLAAECRTPINCKESNCRYPNRHHPLLHGARRVFAPSTMDSPTQPPPATPEAAVATTSASVLSTSSADCIALNAIVPVRLYSGKNFVDTLAMLDPGSQVTMVRNDVAARLGVTGRPSHIRLGTFHGQDPSLNVKIAELRLASRDESFAVDAKGVFIVPSLYVPRYPSDYERCLQHLTYLSNLDVWGRAAQDVTVLIGVDIQDAHLQLDHRRPPRGTKGPIALRTPFGWCLIGKAWSAGYAHTRYVHHIHAGIAPSKEVLSFVEAHWRTESFGTLPDLKLPPSPEDARAVNILKDSIQFVDGHYQVALPWKANSMTLPDNEGTALRRFYAVERRLTRDPELALAYEKIIEDYIQRGFASLVDSPIASPRKWFLPHHAVLNPNKPGSVRIVFDASACHDTFSLNKSLLKGPDLMTSLFAVLLRFRERQFAVSADIEKMFHQVLVEPIDRDSLLFWWRSPGSNERVRIYRMNVHIFGAVSSPTVCNFALRQVALDNASEYSDIAGRIVDNFYVDNYLDSFDSEEEAVLVSSRIRDLLQLGGFKLTKWLSPSKTVLSAFPSSDWNRPELNLDLDDLPVERTLGYSWDSQQDIFIFRFYSNAGARTRRQLLSAVSSIFDPLGLIAPVVFIAKVLLQDTWREPLDWDEDLPSSIVSSWRRWCLELDSLEEISIPRCISSIQLNDVDIQLHIFGDASEKGFGSAAYLRVASSSIISVRLVAAKSRLAPLRSLTIPKLELQAAVLSTRLASTTQRELRIQISRVVFWTDSRTVLCWLASPHRVETFVANRVAEIRESSRLEDWRHVPGSLNPADDVSRGLWPSQLDPTHRWFHGPDFLASPESEWPTSSIDPGPQLDFESVNTIVSIADNGHEFEKFVRRFIIYRRVIRVLAWIRRLRPRARLSSLLRPELSPEELEDSRVACVKLVQARHFNSEIDQLRCNSRVNRDSSLLKLAPFLDHHGILRVGGRLDRSTLPNDAKHPILLHPHHHFTRLIVRHFHVQSHHASSERTLAEIRSQYWIVRGRRVVRDIIRWCTLCDRLSARPLQPEMAPLPSPRVKGFQFAFTNTGVDFCGPFKTIVRRRPEKRYIALFTCLNTRAVHFEVAHSLDADSFLMALSRFTDRRGTPALIYSDNGSNFVAGERELRETVEALNSTSQIIDSTARRGITWRFNPPSAPHFGGVWERLVRSLKDSLYRILLGRSVSDESFVTVVNRVESFLNNRPLSHLSEDPNDPQPLTPNHFLLGRANPLLPSDNPESEPCARRRWKHVQFLMEQLWRRWMKEFLPTLQQRKKWTTSSHRNLQVDDVVLVIDPNAPRSEWNLGRITRTMPGGDGVVRTVEVRTRTGTYVRPVTRLCLLESLGFVSSKQGRLCSEPSGSEGLP